jgi:hypothetical protein
VESRSRLDDLGRSGRVKRIYMRSGTIDTLLLAYVYCRLILLFPAIWRLGDGFGAT